MNENPEGTPNPLNPNPGPAPAGAGPAPAAPAAPAPQPTPPVATPPVAAEPVAAPVAEPTAEPNPKGSVVEPENKPKTGLIVTIILLVCAVIGGIVAAILVLKPFGNKGDAVTMAIQKLFEGNGPSKVSTDGTITLVSESSDVKFKADIKSAFDSVSMQSYTNADLTLTLPNDNEISLKANEVYTSDGDLYFKLSNVEEAITNFMNISVEDEYDCLDGEDDCAVIEPTQDLSGVLSYFSDIIEMVDDEWIHVSSSELESLLKSVSPNSDNSTKCLLEATNSASEYKDDFAEFYKENPFIVSSTENLKISQKKNQLYLVSFDGEKLTGFLNSVYKSDLTKKLATCLGADTEEEEIPVEEVEEMLKDMPELYTEIDNDYNFTRIYLAAESTENDMTATVDFSFDYPTSITVEEPDEYTDLSEIIMKVTETLRKQNTSQQF